MEGENPGKYLITENNIISVVKQLSKLRDELNCAICLEIFTDPVQINCEHCYCTKCIEQLFTKGRPNNLRIPCPLCKKPINKRSSSRVYDSSQLILVKSLIHKLETKFNTSFEKIRTVTSSSGVLGLEEILENVIVSNGVHIDSMNQNASKFSSFIMKNSSLKHNKKVMRKTKSLNCVINRIERKSLIKRHSINNITELLTQQELFKEKCHMVITMVEDDCIDRLNQEFRNNQVQSKTDVSNNVLKQKRPQQSSTEKKNVATNGWSRIKKMNKKLGNKRKQPEQLNVSNSHHGTVPEQPRKKTKVYDMEAMESFYTKNLPICTLPVADTSNEAIVLNELEEKDKQTTGEIETDTAEINDTKKTKRLLRSSSKKKQNLAKDKVSYKADIQSDLNMEKKAQELVDSEQEASQIVPTKENVTIEIPSNEDIAGNSTAANEGDEQSVEEFLNDIVKKLTNFAKHSNGNKQLYSVANLLERKKISILNNKKLNEPTFKDASVQTKDISEKCTSTAAVQTDETLVCNRIIQTIGVQMKDAINETDKEQSIQSLQSIDVALKNILSPNVQNVGGVDKRLNACINKFNNTKRQLSYGAEKENEPQHFKRIHAPTDADSDSEENPIPKNIILNQKDVSVQFFSECENEQFSKRSESLKNSINSDDDMNYDEYLDKVLHKCDEDLEYNDANTSQGNNKVINLSADDPDENPVESQCKISQKLTSAHQRKKHVRKNQNSASVFTVKNTQESDTAAADKQKSMYAAIAGSLCSPSNSESINIIENTEDANKRSKAPYEEKGKRNSARFATKVSAEVETPSETEFAEMFRGDIKFTGGGGDDAQSQLSRNIIESSEPHKSTKFKHKRTLSLQKKNSGEVLSCNPAELEEMFKEPFETQKESLVPIPASDSESINIIEGTEFTCRMPQKVVRCDNNSEQFVTAQSNASLSVNLVEGTEFSYKTQRCSDRTERRQAILRNADNNLHTNSNISVNFVEASEEQMILGRDSPTLFSPAPSDDELTLVETTPPRKTKSNSPRSVFVLPPPLEESILEIAGAANSLPTSLLLPPAEFLGSEVPDDDEPLSSTQNNGCNFKEQQKSKNFDSSLEYSLLQMCTPHTPMHENDQQTSTHTMNPIFSVMNDTHCPLTIVKPTLPPPSPALQMRTVQKSILNYMKGQEEATAKGGGDCASLPAKKPCIACTRLSKDKIIAINGLCTKKLATYSKDFSSSVTHMVVLTTAEDNRVKDHTIKYLSAVAAGVWVVSYRWVEECVARGRIVAEEPYEVLDVTGTPGPRTSRLNRLTHALLKNYRIHCAPPFETTTLRDLEDVVRNLGGTVVHRPEDLLKKASRQQQHQQVCLIITEARITQDFEQYEEWLDRHGVISVDIEWLSRSVGQYNIISVRPYILCSEDNLETLGLPTQLLAHVPDSQLTYT